MTWHNLSVQDTLKELRTNKYGLSEDEAADRLKEYGSNQTEEKGRKTLLARFIDQFKNFMVIILLIAAAVSAATTILSGGKRLDRTHSDNIHRFT